VRALLAVFAAAAFPSASPVHTDGARYAAWQPQTRTLVVRDDRTLRTRKFAIAPGCWVTDVHRGIVLLACNSGPLLVLPGERELRSVPGHTFASSEDYYMGVGTRWLEGRDYHGGGGVFYTDWRTGDTRYFEDDTRERDLDSRDLHLLRPPKHHPGCQRGGGYVTCTWGSVIEPLTIVTAYDSRSGKRLRRWRLKTDLDSAQHTARFVYFNVYFPAYGGRRYDVHHVRWRR
jgi:hypothetical protein